MQMLLALAVSLPLAFAGTPRADRFDLDCHGRVMQEPSEPEHDIDFGLRVDLAQRFWCWSDCVAVRSVSVTGPDRILLINNPPPGKRGPMGVFWSIMSYDRRSGDFSFEIRNAQPAYHLLQTGHCEERPFTGIPRNGA